MLNDETQPSASTKKAVTRFGAPPPAPLGNQRALGNKQKPDFLTKALISQLHETVKREKPVLQLIPAKKGSNKKPTRRWIISQETHEKIHFIVEALLENAMNGETDAIKYVFDRIEGRPVTTFPEDGNDGAITVRFLPQDQRI